MRRTHIHCTENNVSDVHVDDVEDGLQDAHHQQLEGVQLPDDDAEGDQDAGGGQTTLQHTAQGGGHGIMGTGIPKKFSYLRPRWTSNTLPTTTPGHLI